MPLADLREQHPSRGGVELAEVRGGAAGVELLPDPLLHLAVSGPSLSTIEKPIYFFF